MKLLLLTLLILVSSQKEWKEEYEVCEINGHNQFEELRKSHEILIIEFYTNWCIDCKNLAPFY
jgi:thiol-disulfide isomerase/thioredoxin